MENNDAISQSIQLLEREVERLSRAIKILKGDTITGNISAVSYSSVHAYANLTDANANKSVLKSESNDDYDVNWELRQKFLYFLKKLKRFVHLREIADLIIKAEGKDPNMASSIASQIGAKILILKQKGEIVKFQETTNNLYAYWGSKNWMDEKGKIKSGYEYNDEYPKKTRIKNVALDLGL